MIPRQPRSRTEEVKLRKDAAARKLAWPTYLGIIAPLLLFVVALAGGIIWYNSLKTTELMVAAAERQMIETAEKISERIGLLYDPLYAIVAFASQVPELKAPLHDDGHTGMPMLLRALRFYPQILSLYVGFDNGDFFMVSHIAGEGRARLRVVLGAPEKAAFANEIITAGKDGGRTERWIFLDDDGVEVGRREVATTSFDPQQRPWYGPARSSDLAQRSDLYIFASNNEPGFSLSRRFTAVMSGVLGADLAASDLSDFLSKQRVTPTSVSFIFTRSGEIVAFPDKARVAALVPRTGEMMLPLPKLTELNEPAAAGLFAAYQASGVSGTLVYTVADRTYIGRIVEIAARYGRDQLLAIAVPIDEIQRPIIELRNRTLFYSIAVLVFVLPLYVTLVVAWIDRRLGRSRLPLRAIESE